MDTPSLGSEAGEMPSTSRPWPDADQRVRLQRDERYAVDQFPAGSDWLYRLGKAKRPFAQARVIAVAEGRPVRVWVRLVDDDSDGERVKATTAKLLAPWHLRNEFMRWEGAWKDLAAVSPGNGVVFYVWMNIIDDHLPPEVFDMHHPYGRGGAIIGDRQRLALATGLDESSFDDPLGIIEDGKEIVSWNVVSRVAGAIAQRNDGAVGIEALAKHAARIEEGKARMRENYRIDEDLNPWHQELLDDDYELYRDLESLVEGWIGRPAASHAPEHSYALLQEARALLTRALPELHSYRTTQRQHRLIDDILEFKKRLD